MEAARAAARELVVKWSFVDACATIEASETIGTKEVHIAVIAKSIDARLGDE